jgi:preprotein translocase subunit Sec63
VGVGGPLGDTIRMICASKDYYEILGVTKRFTSSELKSAYRKLALKVMERRR